jgi:tetratricopeptide (TPR) repeat protein
MTKSTIQNKSKNKNQKMIFVHLVFVICAYFGFCALTFGIQVNAYALNTDRMRVLFLSGDYDACIAEGEKLLAGPGYSRQMDELYYLLALSYLKQGNYLRSSDIFEIILKEFKDSAYKEAALVGLGDAYFLSNDYTKALAVYQDLLQRYPKTKYAAVAFYRISQCAFKTGVPALGNEYACKLKDTFPLNLEGKVDTDIACPFAYYSVQVGSFSQEKNATNLVRKLSQQGCDAYIDQASGQGKPLYRVRVGKVATQQEAVRLAEELAQQGYPTKVCP